MSRKEKPPPALFGTLPEQDRPEIRTTDTHTRSPCQACEGKGGFKAFDKDGNKFKQPCRVCGGAGSILTRNPDDA